MTLQNGTTPNSSVVSPPRIDPLDLVFEELDQDIKNRPQSPPLPTGIEPLDRLIWGLHKRELCVLGGRPGHGKSSLALYVAYNLAHLGKRVLFLSLEMTREQLLERLLCHVTDMDSWKLRTGNPPEDYPQKAEQFRSVVKTLPLFIIDQWGFVFNEISSMFTQKQLELHPDVLIIDYVQLIRVEEETDRRNAIINYMTALKQFAMRYNLSIVVLSQLGREAAKGKPGLEHFKESGHIEEAADCAMLVWWKGMEDQVDSDRTEYHILVKKQRHGPTGEAIINFNPIHFKFSPPKKSEWVTLQNEPVPERDFTESKSSQNEEVPF